MYKDDPTLTLTVTTGREQNHDTNGNMTSDGVNSYTWDRANRLLSMGGVDYQYDGEGRRVQQTFSSNVTKYLLDIQPGLSVVLSETTGSDVTRNIHAPKGIHARKDASSNWHWMMQDGLGSVRAEVSNGIAVEGSQNFAPYGTPTDSLGSFGTYGFTGEPTDVNDLIYDRARYYVPSIGMFASLDPFEGFSNDAISLNGYGYASANPINLIDPSGFSPEEDFWTGFLHGVADALPWELGDPGYWDRKANPLGCARGFGSWCDPRDFAKRLTQICSTPPMTPQQERHQAFLNAVTPIFQSIAGASHWARVSLGYEQLPQGVSRLQAAAETLLGVVDVFSSGGISDIRSGDTNRVIGGVLKIAGLVEGINAGYRTYNSLFPEAAFNPISGTITGEAYVTTADGRRVSFSFSLDGTSLVASDGSSTIRLGQGGGGSRGILADNNLLVAASEQGSINALNEIRNNATFVTSNQLNEFLDVNTYAQRRARQAFLKAENVLVIDGQLAQQLAQSAEFQEVFLFVKGQQGRADAALVAFARTTGYEALTLEKRLYNFIVGSTPKAWRGYIPIRKVIP